MLHGYSAKDIAVHFDKTEALIKNYIEGTVRIPQLFFDRLLVQHDAEFEIIYTLIALKDNNFQQNVTSIDMRINNFEELKRIYPKRQGGQRYKEAFAHYKVRLKDGFTHEAILAVIENYARHCKAFGKTHTVFVKQMATFMNDPENLTRTWEERDNGKSNKNNSNRILQETCRREAEL
uniref:Uncharacterized protein n=2 Tax=viral metagenome TaxID=1070528 RepID=A0A6M3KNG1_9ZZZZ